MDPLCPWCYQTMRWAIRLVELGQVTVRWAVFSLAIVNRGDEGRAEADKGSARALRTAVAVRESLGNDSMGRFFASLGEAIHEHEQDVEDLQTIRGALASAGLDAGIADTAITDPSTWGSVVAEHDAVVAQHKAFGVPTVVLDGGTGPAIFGPVISELPDDRTAVEMWRHVSWLVRNDNFSELKRGRQRRPSFNSGDEPSREGEGKAQAA